MEIAAAHLSAFNCGGSLGWGEEAGGGEEPAAKGGRATFLLTHSVG